MTEQLERIEKHHEAELHTLSQISSTTDSSNASQKECCDTLSQMLQAVSTTLFTIVKIIYLAAKTNDG